jgi:SH3-like domain-containing protein
MKKTFAMMYVFFLIMIITPNCSYALCVKVQKANIRSGPGTSYEKVWEVYKYMPFKKVGVSLSGDWYAVRDVDGDVNWIYKSLVTDKYHCAVVSKEEVNVRSKPGKNQPKSFLRPAKHYDTFKVLKRKGIWVRVKDEWNNIGWIHSNFLWIR